MRTNCCMLGALVFILFVAPAYAAEVELIDTEFIVVNSSTTSPNSSVLDASSSPVQSNPSSQSYIIDTEFTVVDKSELKPWSGDSVPIIVPTASFNYTTSGLTAYFMSTSHYSNGHITAYNWNFGDGETSNIRNPTHIYSASGEYPVTLTVTGNDSYKGLKTEVISVDGGAITRVSNPSDIPYGTELTVEVDTSIETEISVDFDTFYQTKHGTAVIFNIDTTAFTNGEHTLTVTAGSDTYTNQIIIYEPVIYQSITKGIDDIGTFSKNEIREISGITGYTLTNHIYTLLLKVEVGNGVTADDVLNNLRDKLGFLGSEVKTQLEIFKSILVTIDPSASNHADDMDHVINSITNIQTAINEFNEQVSDENIVGTVNEYVMKPAVYAVICDDEANLIDIRTRAAKGNLGSHYPPDQVDTVNEVLLIGKEAIANTDAEQIYRLYIGTVLGHDISVEPTLDYFAGKQTESLNPPDMCALGYCIPGKYNPVWVYHMTVADAESILTVPAYIGWIPATPEDEIIQPSFVVMFEPVTMTIQAIKAYMKYADMIEKFSPWLIDGGMVVSTDLLSKEVDEEHADVIQAVYDIILSSGASSVSTPISTESSLYVPKGNILVTTSPDGEIRGFKYVKSDSKFSAPKNRRVVSLNTGWSQSFGSESENISIAILSDESSYNINDTVYLTVDISSDVYVEDAMLWIFVPEANETIKDIFDVAIGNMSKNYNFTVQSETWHVLKVYLANFGTVLAENYTSFGVGSQSRESGVVIIDSDKFYDSGTIRLNVTVHNSGDVLLDSKLEYFGSHPDLTGLVDVPVLEVGEDVVESLLFNLTDPDVYEMHFMLNSSAGALDYNVVGFTVRAHDTLLAFPSTDKPIYNASEDVNIAVTIKNITLNVVDFPYSVITTTPSSNIISSTSFVPYHNGTYIVKAKPVAEGYCVVEGETLFIVEKQSSLVVETETVDNTTMIKVKTDAGGAVKSANVVVNGHTSKTDENGVVEFTSANATQLIIRAEKFGFNPALVSVNLSVEYEEPPLVSIIPPNTDIMPGETAYATAKVTQGGSHNLEIMDVICKDTNGDGNCNDFLSNPGAEISIVFDDTDNLTTTTVNGEAKIKITLHSSKTENRKYWYSVRAGNGQWEEASITVRTAVIPEFSTIFLPIMLTFLSLLAIKRKIIKNHQTV
ncbi:MAG: PKD domain-containing protein [archaeon]|nr:PKD domain-containing protein [archaeon]